MSKPFLITGLPRSRTAWLSIAATTQGSICFHEPTADLGSFEALKTLWADDRYAFVGVSDSSLVMQLGRILREVAPRVLIVDRDPQDAERSWETYIEGQFGEFDVSGFMQRLHAELSAYGAHPLVEWVDYDDLENPTIVGDALSWLMPGLAFPKLEELMHMNVQVDRDWVVEKARAPHTNWHTDTSWKSR